LKWESTAVSLAETSAEKDTRFMPVENERFQSLLDRLGEIVRNTDIVRIPGNAERMLTEISRILKKASLTNRDTNILQGLISAVARKLN
jgi:tRNA C32,U32 (ribose-2'-O)-methylase TrmJ